MDTLKAIALDWDRKTIDDAEARRRADALGKVVFHPDETVTGDGGWYEGDPDNLMTAVRAAIGTTKANEFRRNPPSRPRVGDDAGIGGSPPRRPLPGTGGLVAFP